MVTAAGCVSIRELPERVVHGVSPFSKLHSELYTVAEVERTGREEFIVRFPGTALFGVDEYLHVRKQSMGFLHRVSERHGTCRDRLETERRIFLGFLAAGIRRLAVVFRRFGTSRSR